MKRLLLIFTCALTGFLLTGCKDSSTSESSDAAKPSAPSATETATAEIKKSTEKAVDEVAAEARKQAGEVVAEVQKQAKAVYDDLSQKLIENTKGNANELLKEISSDLEKKVAVFSDSLQDTGSIVDQLNDALKALVDNQDIDAVKAFNSISAAKLTPEQTTLAKDIYNAGAAFATERNFSSIEGMNSDVAKLSTAVWQGNYAEALQPLQKIWNQGTLTTEQKDLLGTVFDEYLPGWQEKAGVVGQGLDAIKKFGQ